MAGHCEEKDERKREFMQMMEKSKEEIINDYFVEKDCKNHAYYFILWCGYFDEYKEWSKKH